MRILIFSTTYVWSISHSKKKWARYDKKMYIGFQEKCPLFLSGCNETWIFSTLFRKHSNIKLQENLSSGSRVVPCGRTDKTKLIVAFRNSANAPESNRLTKRTHCVCVWLWASGWVGGSKGMLWWLGFNLVVKGSGVLRCDAQPLPHSLLHTNWPPSTAGPLIATPVTTQNVQRHSQNPLVHRRFHSSSPRMIPNLGRIKPVHNFKPYLFSTHFYNVQLYSDSLRAGRSGVRIPVGVRLPAPVQTGAGAQPASCTMGTGPLSRG